MSTEGRTRHIRVLGIGMGPQQVTVEVARALQGLDLVLATDKSATDGAHAGDGSDELLAVRRAVAEQYGVELVAVPDPPRDRDPEDYQAAVRAWHAARLEAFEAVLAERFGDEGYDVGFLAWGDPALYDSTNRIVEQLAERVGASWEVLPGISAPQLLAARHRIVLHRVGESVHLTTARRLADDIAAGQRNLVVMLGRADLDGLDEWTIWWGANLGATGEQLVAGRVGEVRERIDRARAAAQQEAGWVMDLCLLRDER